MAMSALIKSLEDIMRKDAGLNGDAQYIEQITWLLFLKAFDAKEMEWEFRPEYRGSTIPEGFRWRDWADDKEGITGDALIKFVDELFDKLKKLDVSDGDLKKFVIRNVFTDINNYMKSGIYLRQLINRINEKVDFIDATQKHTFNELYEGMLKDLQSAGRAGEFYTPRPVTNFIVEKIDPKLGETVLDPACGTGGFLTSTIAHMGSITTTEQLNTLQTTIFGWEKKPLPYLLAMTNLILHDIETPQIRHINSLNRPVTDYSAKDRVDVIVANPPFGGAEDDAVKQNFPAEFRTSETADLFLVLMMYLLKDKGMDTKKLPDVFVSYAADTLAETNSGLTGAQIVKYCNSYAVDFGVDIPITSSDFGSFGSLVPNKRTALYRNLSVFSGQQQFVIIILRLSFTQKYQNPG